MDLNKIAQEREKEKATKELFKVKHKIPRNTYRTIKGQIKSGDIAGAMRGIKKIRET